MPSVPDQPCLPIGIHSARFQRLPDHRHIRLTSTQRRVHFRSRLILVLQSIRRFSNIVECDLRPMWRREGLKNTPWTEISEGSEYATAVRYFVRDDLKLREHGKESPYFVAWVHGLVRGEILAPFEYEISRAIRGTLEVRADTIGRSSVWTTLGDEAEPRTVDEKSDYYAIFQDWDGLRHRAHAALDSLLDAMRLEFEAAVDQNVPGANQTTRLQRLESDLLELIEVLWLGTKQAKHRRSSRHRLLEDLGLDPI